MDIDMSLRQQLEDTGYAWSFLRNVLAQPRAVYYSRDEGTGETTKHILPSDPYSLLHYLSRGFKLNPADIAQPVALAQEGFACQDCVKSFKSKFALLGHKKIHKK